MVPGIELGVDIEINGKATDQKIDLEELEWQEIPRERMSEELKDYYILDSETSSVYFCQDDKYVTDLILYLQRPGEWQIKVVEISSEPVRMEDDLKFATSVMRVAYA